MAAYAIFWDDGEYLQLLQRIWNLEIFRYFCDDSVAVFVCVCDVRVGDVSGRDCNRYRSDSLVQITIAILMTRHNNLPSSLLKILIFITASLAFACFISLGYHACYFGGDSNRITTTTTCHHFLTILLRLAIFISFLVSEKGGGDVVFVVVGLAIVLCRCGKRAFRFSDCSGSQ